MATVQCSKCTAERKGFRRELDSWRHKLIHCVGFESILEGICGPMLLGDLKLHDGCQPEEVDDWIPASFTQCSFCNLPLDKVTDQAPSSTSPLSSPSDYSPCQAPTISENHQSAHRFLQAVFHKKEAHLGCDSSIPLAAQELMKKMVHQFALEYASKCLLNTSTHGVTTRTSSPLSETADAPLDLTVSRTQEKEDTQSEPDAVLDLSNRNSATSTFSSTQKASGCLLPLPAEDLGKEEHGRHQTTALDAVLSSLCPSHRSLLYQIMKVAQQEQLLLFLNHRHAGQHCYCGVNTEENFSPNVAPVHKCKTHSCCSFNLVNSFNCPGHDSTTCPPLNSKPNGSRRLYHLKNSKAGAHPALGCCCLQTAEVEAYAVLCPKRLHLFPCPSLAVCHSSNSMCSLASSSNSASACTVSSSLCPSLATCCRQQKLHAYCYTSFFTVGENQTEREVRDADPPCPVLKREQSPSPPPLSPIPSDGSKKCDEKPPSLFPHRQWEEDASNPGHQETNLHNEKQQQDYHPPTSSHAEQNPSVTILQDVMNRFSEKLETIRPVEKDPPLDSTAACVSENEPPPSPSTSQKVHFHGDAHLTEIITTVLHTGSASDYNLSELFHHQDSKGPKSPNTRARRRQEVLAALAAPHDASSRRHTLQIKRELALLDQSHTRRKVSLSKRAKSKDQNVGITLSNTHSDIEGPKQDKDPELEPFKNDRSGDGSPKFSMAECGEGKTEEEIKAVVITQEVLDSKAEQQEKMISNEETKVAGVELQIPGPEPQSTLQNKSLKNDSFPSEPETTLKRPRKVGRPRKSTLCDGANTNGLHQESPSGPDGRWKPTASRDGNSKDGGRTRRRIVPPQRFSSFVTESRKMYYVACFSKNIFSKGVQTDTALYQEAEGEETPLKTAPVELPQEFPHDECGPSTCEASQSPSSVQDVSVRDQSPAEDSPGCLDRGADVLQRLQSTSNRTQDVKIPSKSATNLSDATTPAASADVASTCQLQFTSPIKLMFVSPVKDEEGVRYSLKAAGPGCKGQAEEAFDPCEESSWSRTPPKRHVQTAESDVLQMNSVSSPVKSATSPSPRAASPSRPASPLMKARSSPPTRSSSLSPSKLSSSPAKHSSTALKSGPSPKRSPTSPAKSLRAASSSPKISPRRSGEGTPTKLLGDAAPLESAPQKRRPGRPKKLKPQLEQKVKRPIGRPRKQKDADSAAGMKKSDGNTDKPSDAEETATKNLKITVVYGRSRRNKRTVSEGFDQLQTEFRDACQAAGLKSDLRILTHGSNANSVSVKSSIVEPPEMVHFISPLKEATTQSSSNIKCPKREDSAPIRKPGRPAKIKISGISVTVTTVSPRQRKIQMRKNTRQDPKTLVPAKMRSPELKAAKSSLAILSKSAGKNGILDAGTEAEDSGQDGVAVRHSARVRKPSIHFLHAVATSAYRSYSRSNALLRRSKQLLLNKVSNERKQAEHASSVEFRGERAFSCETGRQKIAEELGRVAGVSVDSIFSPKEVPKWWAASAEEKTMNQEFARRIRLISDTWVSDMTGNQEKETALNSKLSSKLEGRKPRTPSVVRALFDCSPNKPRSCSMQQLCSWFMKTTETRSLAIVKKTSSRNPYEVMHFPRPGSSKSVCHSPQTERLRKHIKKFAKIVPKSPLEHRLMQRRARAAPRQSARGFKRKLFTAEGTEGKRGAKWRSKKVLSNYQATLRRARTRFSSRKDRQRQRSKEDVADVCNRFVGRLALAPNPKHQALRISKHYRHLEDPCATGSAVKRGHPAEVPKEQNLCCKAWSPEKLKECRVFLRKINSPDSESAEEEWDSCTVTLDDGWPPADLVAGRRRELAEAVKAVKTKKRTRPSRALPRKRAGCAPGVAKEPNEIPTRGRKGKRKLPGDVAAEPPQPPPAKLLRQSRMRGLTGPRWCDFVFEN